MSAVELTSRDSQILEPYQVLVHQLDKIFGSSLKTVVLFGSRARGSARTDSDHDILLIIDDIPVDALERHQAIRRAVTPVLTALPPGIKFIAITPAELDSNLTPLLLDVCVDGICMHRPDFFEPYRNRALAALEKSGLERKIVGRGTYWMFRDGSTRDWELEWDGFRERS